MEIKGNKFTDSRCGRFPKEVKRGGLKWKGKEVADEDK